MNTDNKKERKYVRSLSGEYYPYWLVIATLAVTSVSAAVLMGIGLILILGDPINHEKVVSNIIAKAFLGPAMCYAAYKIWIVFDRVRKQF